MSLALGRERPGRRGAGDESSDPKKGGERPLLFGVSEPAEDEKPQKVFTGRDLPDRSRRTSTGPDSPVKQPSRAPGSPRHQYQHSETGSHRSEEEHTLSRPPSSDGLAVRRSTSNDSVAGQNASPFARSTTSGLPQPRTKLQSPAGYGGAPQMNLFSPPAGGRPRSDPLASEPAVAFSAVQQSGDLDEHPPDRHGRRTSQDALTDVESQLALANQRLSEKKVELDDVTNKLRQMTAELMRVSDEAADLRSSHAEAVARAGRLEAEHDALERQKLSAEGERDRLKTDLEARVEECGALSAELSTIRSELSDSKAFSEAVEQSRNQEKKRADQATEDLERTRSELADQKKRYLDDVGQATSALELVRSEMTVLKASLAKEKEGRAHAETELQHLQDQQMARLKAQMERTTTDIVSQVAATRVANQNENGKEHEEPEYGGVPADADEAPPPPPRKASKAADPAPEVRSRPGTAGSRSSSPSKAVKVGAASSAAKTSGLRKPSAVPAKPAPAKPSATGAKPGMPAASKIARTGSALSVSKAKAAAPADPGSPAAASDSSSKLKQPSAAAGAKPAVVGKPSGIKMPSSSSLSKRGSLGASSTTSSTAGASAAAKKLKPLTNSDSRSGWLKKK